jgi:hypothetical protein
MAKNLLDAPAVLADSEDKLKLFYLAGEDRVWHPATMKIEGEKIVVSFPDVKAPRGVAYGTGGIGSQPSLYNKALLPLAPFIYYDNKLVTSKDWPAGSLKVAGETIDPSSVGKVYAYRKMPLLSQQFEDNAVLQAGKPVTIWGSTRDSRELYDRYRTIVLDRHAEEPALWPVLAFLRDRYHTLHLLRANFLRHEEGNVPSRDYPFAIWLAMKLHIEVCDAELAYQALAEGDFAKAKRVFSGPFPPEQDERYQWHGPRLHGRALANIGLKDWAAALADIDAAIEAQQRHAKPNINDATKCELPLPGLCPNRIHHGRAVNERPCLVFPIGIANRHRLTGG